MKKAAILIKADGTMRGIYPSNGSDFSLKELQGFVHGLIEIVTLTSNAIMVINEEGKFTQPFNPTATVIAKALYSIRYDDYIAGDVLMCPNYMVK